MPGRRALLDHLLVAPLQRAVALEEMDDVAVLVAEHLHFDVARRDDVFLDQHARIAERRLGLARAPTSSAASNSTCVVDAAHAAPAAARDRLDQHGIADLVGLLLEEFRRLVVAVIAGHDRRAGLSISALAALFRPMARIAAPAAADEDDAGAARRPRRNRRSRSRNRSRVQAFGAAPFARLR